MSQHRLRPLRASERPAPREPAPNTLLALATAQKNGALPRDEYWRLMRQQHELLAEYRSLLTGSVRAIEIREAGLFVVFDDGLRLRWRPEDTRSVPSVAVNHGSYELEEATALTALATGAAVVLDIGANAGFMALRMAKVLGRGGVVHAFEPVPSTHGELLGNIEQNGLAGAVRAHAFALGAQAGSVSFFVPAFHGSVAASERPLFSGENREVAVEMRTLDTFAAAESLPRVDLVKCDVEGAELFVLKGGVETLTRHRPVLMLEMLRKWARAFDYHPNDIIALLSPLGYRCYSLGVAGLIEHTQIDDATVPTNFFFFHAERHAAERQRLERALFPAASAADGGETARDAQSRALARTVRRHVLGMVHRARASHVGSCLSAVDLLAVLYGRILDVRPGEPEWPERDRFILSKGHAAAALYAVLAARGFFPADYLEHYCEDGGVLAGHVVHHGVPGVEMSTGSLGHGLSLAAGMALSARADAKNHRTFVLLSDGECDEGSTWEAALFAGHQRLGRLVAIVDHNAWQGFGKVSEVLDLEPFADKWRAFGWRVVETDGHDHAALGRILEHQAQPDEAPTLVLAHTVKGKGVSFMEDSLEWHYRSPNEAELARALRELEAEEAAES